MTNPQNVATDKSLMQLHEPTLYVRTLQGQMQETLTENVFIRHNRQTVSNNYKKVALNLKAMNTSQAYLKYRDMYITTELEWKLL